MERLWAPWRMDYIRTGEKDTSCIFCLRDDICEDRERQVLARSEFSLTMLNRYPYTCGHILVAPVRHTASLEGIDDDELLDLMRAVRRACAVLKEVASPEGVNIGMNLGRAAGAGVENHLHVHIVPRWCGDTNYMTVVADLRVIPEGLDQSYARLRVAFDSRP